jgi:predicted extracellular nuclease
MKKLLLSVVALISFLTIHAQCNELFISEYVEGTGNDKALEIFNPTNSPVNLSGYRLERFSNGSTTSSAGGVLNLTGTIAAHDVFVVVNGQTTGGASSPACSPALQALADQLDGVYPAPTYMNGNDAIALFKNSTMIDIFGKIGEDPGQSWSDVSPFTDASGSWWTKDHTLKRKEAIQQGVTTNPTLFNVTVEWDSLPKDTWTGLGTHTCSCPTGISEIDNTVSVVVYPNPANHNYFNVSASESIQAVEVYNIMGQLELDVKGNKTDKQMTVETADLAKGVYVVKISFAKNKNSIVKLSVE